MSDKKSFVLSKYDDIFDVFATQYTLTQSQPLLVLDDGLSDDIKSKWNKFTYIPSEKDCDGNYCVSKTVNKGFDLLSPNDVLCYSDDCYIETPELYQELEFISYQVTNSGLVVPAMSNVYCSFQREAWAKTLVDDYHVDLLRYPTYIVLPLSDSRSTEIYSGYIDVSAACFFIKRDVINQVGKWDEGFIGAADYPDLDYSIRIRQKNFSHVVATNCFVEHGGKHFQFADRNTRERIGTDSSAHTYNEVYFKNKWKLH